MQKIVYLVIYPDWLELPVDYFESITKLAKHVGVSVEQMQIIIKEHKKVKNRYFESIIQ